MTSTPSQAPAGPVIELRRYRLQRHARETLIDLFDREFLETQDAAGMSVLAQFRDLDDPDAFVWLRRFEGLPQRAVALRSFYTGPVWAQHCDAANGTMVNSDNVLMLTPLGDAALTSMLGPGPLPASFGEHRPPPAVDLGEAGVFEMTTCYLAPRTDTAFSAWFEDTICPVLRAAGARIEGRWVVDHRENNFQRLPVREGETLFIWLLRFDGDAQQQAFHQKLAASAVWRDELQPEICRRTWRENEVVRLAPTRRSLLR
ncbi:MAG: NIPSNAP family protein [Polaromonas sp.]|nr:NIPSNAP family protein [Polaromonas sp.]